MSRRSFLIPVAAMSVVTTAGCTVPDTVVGSWDLDEVTYASSVTDYPLSSSGTVSAGSYVIEVAGELAVEETLSAAFAFITTTTYEGQDPEVDVDSYPITIAEGESGQLNVSQADDDWLDLSCAMIEDVLDCSVDAPASDFAPRGYLFVRRTDTE